MTTTNQDDPYANIPAVVDLLSKSQRILLTTHERTDGDDLSSVLTLKLVLDRLGKHTTVVIKGGVPETLSFLPGAKAVKEHLEPGQTFDLLIISGCSTLDRTGLPYTQPRITHTLNIDHHPDNSFFGSLNLVNPKAAAVAEVVYELLSQWGIEIDQSIAQCLLTGIITDTGSFIHSNTTARTLKIAGLLFQKGARPGFITKHTYGSKSPQTLKALAKALANTVVDYQKQMSYSLITKKDLEELGNPPMTAFDGLVETINKIPEAKFALFLKQDGPMVKGSLRSDAHKFNGGVDVSELAKRYGGGGHKYAAGFSVLGTLIHGPNHTWKILPSSNT
jgi:phosphoesterase RecJ-like protein